MTPGKLSLLKLVELLRNDGTPPKTYMSPEKWWLEDDPFLLKWLLFRGLVSFQGCIGSD